MQTAINNHHWQWKKAQDSVYLTCNLLSDWQHGFFTKEFHPQNPENLTSILQLETTAYRAKQIHSNLVLTAQEIDTTITEQNLINSLPDADGVISNQSAQSVWVASADCTPILIGDRHTGRVCAIHAGWRGTSQKIVKKAIERFLEFGSQKDHLRIAIGPAIGGKVYQVDHSVAIKVGQTIITNAANKDENQILSELKQLPNSPILDDDLPEKVRLNVPQVNQIQLEQLDINPAHIASAQEFCTYQHSDSFFSYRRTGEKKVQWSGIVAQHN